ncbi:hypothetical protein [Actinoplanes flavus]|uniref:HEAT repeat domain-containing protein n=1 Tax=Actinoplanes flavus TaxID=2820290 RepID=A0ABS3URZ5_9ACTN|nr:hypothetical protein [Actinoplanes flavus]MBO3741213.1 hypothetical protein [Actinoplanes flavus]
MNRIPDGAAAATNPERETVETLQWRGDPRWVHLGPHLASPRRATFTPEVLAAVRARLAQHVRLIDVVASWGPRAADAVPDLIALLPETGSIAAGALARIGHAGPEMMPYLWGIADDGDIDAAAAIRRLTGNPGLLLAALDGAFGSVGQQGLRGLIPPRPPYPVRPPLLDAGADLMPAVPAARACLTGEPMHGPDRRAQILAAVVTVAATGDSTTALPTLRALLSAVSPDDVVDVAELLADLLGPDAELIARLDELINGGRLLSTGTAADIAGADDAIRRRLRDIRQGLT